MFLGEIASKYRFRHIGKTLPHLVIGIACDVGHHIGNLLWWQDTIQHLLNLARITQQVNAVRELARKFLHNRLEHGNRHRSKFGDGPRYLPQLIMIKLLQQPGGERLTHAKKQGRRLIWALERPRAWAALRGLSLIHISEPTRR